jgi:hypothetical protein
MKKNAMYVIFAVVIIVIVFAGVGTWYYTGGGGSPSAKVTAVDFANATSVSFTANVTCEGMTSTYRFQGINIHSNNTIFRVDLSGGYSYIVNCVAMQGWQSHDGGANWVAGDFTEFWNGWIGQWQDYINNLGSTWDGVESSFTITDSVLGTAVVSNIVVNQTIPPSTFNEA